MPEVLPLTLTYGDLCKEALQDSGYLGIGANPLAEDLNKALVRLQQLLMQWQKKRWLVYCLNNYSVTSTGQATPYTIGPAGGAAAPQIAYGTYGQHQRPNRIEQAFFRQLVNVPNGPVDYSLKLLPSLEDYNKTIIKGLTNFTLVAFYNPTYDANGFGQLYCWPWPQANLYQVFVAVRQPIAQGFALADKVTLPWEYYRALRTNLALEVRPLYGIATYPGDMLPGMAKDSRACLRDSNTQIPNLEMPLALQRPGIYSIFSDTNY